MDMKKILQALDGASSKPVEGSNDMKKFVQIVNESATPHKVSLPVQMAMNHYQEPKVKKDSVLRKYFKEAEEVVNQQQVEKKQHLQMYAQTIAKRVLENKKTNEGAWNSFKQGVKSTLGMLSPEDIAAKDPKGQMAQLLQLRAKYKGTQHERQIEDRIKNLQFRINNGEGAPAGADGMPKPVVGPDDFAKQNPSFVRESEKQKGVDGKACWDGYKRMGTKKKGGKTVDNCVPTGKK
jgi:hypothetical protein